MQVEEKGATGGGWASEQGQAKSGKGRVKRQGRYSTGDMSNLRKECTFCGMCGSCATRLTCGGGSTRRPE